MAQAERMTALDETKAQAQVWGREAEASLHEAGQLLSSATRCVINLSTEMSVVADQAEAALKGQGIYQRAGMLVRVTEAPVSTPRWLTRPPRAPVVEPLSIDSLLESLSKVAIWLTNDRRVRPPRWVAETLMARASWTFPILETVTDAPVLRPDGSLFDHTGYDNETGCLVFLDKFMSGAVRELGRSPSRDDALEALRTLRDPFGDFPFVGDSDRSAVLAVILTLVGRHLISGPVPMFLSRSPVAGTGKSLLFDTMAMIATGRHLPRMISGRNDEEERKRITAIALAAPSAVLLDNVEHAIGSPALASVLTAMEWEDRILGRSALVSIPISTVWLCTGNNLSVKGDLARRTVPIDLDAFVEQPEERGGFQYPHLLDHVRRNRPQLLLAALTLLRAFLHESPLVALPSFGSFEAWSDLVRACLVWLGEADPCAGMVRIREEGDPDRERLECLLVAWHVVFGEEAITTRQVINRAQSEGDLADALPSPKGGSTTPSSLGYYLRRHRGRIVGGLRLDAEGADRKGVQLWQVEKCR